MKKTIAEIEALPIWELDLWRTAFEVYGPLDWRRLDLFEARSVQMQLTKPMKLKECVLFPAPEDMQEQELNAKDKNDLTEEELLALFGFTS